MTKLETALQPLGITPVLEVQEIDEDSFKLRPAESNRVWISGKPIEEWLGAAVAMTRCCSVCGDSDCRALKVGDHTYETIPADEFIRAGLMAASRMIAASPGSAAMAPSCCAPEPNAEPMTSCATRTPGEQDAPPSPASATASPD